MLKVAGLEVVYSDVIVGLRGVSLEVPDGAIVALLGANGAGKTTCLRAITGLLDVHRGRISKGIVELDGERIDRLESPAIVRRGLAQVLEGRRIFAELTIEENLRTGAHARSDQKGIRRSYDRVMTLFPILGERRNQPAGTFSGGEQQMLAMARAMMSRPKLLMLDEPSMGLSPLMMKVIMQTVRTLQSQGTTILLVEQNAQAALKLADHGYVLEVGKIVLKGTGKDLLVNDAVRKAYLGED